MILIVKNAMRFGAVNTIGFIFNVLGVAFIAGANGMFVYAMLHFVDQFKGLATSWVSPVVAGCLEGMVMGTIFMNVFSFASDTILQCFLVDEDLGKPASNRPALLNDFIDGAEKAHAAENKKGDEGKEEAPK